MKNLLFQDDLFQEQDLDLLDLADRAPRTTSREQLNTLMTEFLNQGGKVRRVKISDSTYVPDEKAQWNYFYRAKDGSNRVRQAPQFFNEQDSLEQEIEENKVRREKVVEEIRQRGLPQEMKDAIKDLAREAGANQENSHE